MPTHCTKLPRSQSTFRVNKENEETIERVRQRLAPCQYPLSVSGSRDESSDSREKVSALLRAERAQYGRGEINQVQVEALDAEPEMHM